MNIPGITKIILYGMIVIAVVATLMFQDIGTLLLMVPGIFIVYMITRNQTYRKPGK